jgi:hypothetical protein
VEENIVKFAFYAHKKNGSVCSGEIIYFLLQILLTFIITILLNSLLIYILSLKVSVQLRSWKEYKTTVAIKQRTEEIKKLLVTVVYI